MADAVITKALTRLKVDSKDSADKQLSVSSFFARLPRELRDQVSSA